MRLTHFLLSALIIILFYNCEKEDNNPEYSTTDILGTWINPEYSDSVITFERTADLVENDYGIKFNNDYSLIERKNSGWCGTPPISYADFDGSWSETDSTITFTVDFWGGIVEETWLIQEVNSEQLIVKSLKWEVVESTN